MGIRNGNVRRYILGALGVIAILAWAWWMFGSAPYFAGNLKSKTLLAREQVDLLGGEATAKACSGCGPNGCSAAAVSWGDLCRKIFGNGNTFSKQGGVQ